VNPSAGELIEAIADTLRNHIAPLVADQPWPASELRTIDALLAHLAQRVRHEDELLREDNADLDVLLAELTAAGVPISIVVDADAPLAEANLARRGALEAAIHLIHAGPHAEQIASVRSYLVRAATRDRRIYQPLADRPLF
jgi:hypothetical protein